MSKKIFNLKINHDDDTPKPILLRSLNIIKAPVLPRKVDLRPKIKFIYDQGLLGSCTANALCYTYLFNYQISVPSRLFLYHNSLVLQNNLNDVGSTLGNAINALNNNGLCNEKTWPYIISKFRNTPSQLAFDEGKISNKIDSSKVFQTLNDLKTCLASGSPFVCGIYVYSSFLNINVSRTGNIPLPNTRRESFLGGHALTCVGYDDTRQVFIMVNSWGNKWGDKGFCYIPYTYLTNRNLSGDFWKISSPNAQPIQIPSYNKKLLLLKKI